MPILLLWVDAVFDDHDRLTRYQAFLTSTDLVSRGDTMFFTNIDARSLRHIERDTVKQLQKAANKAYHSNTWFTVFLAGCDLSTLSNKLKPLIPAVFGMLHHRLMDMEVLLEYVKVWSPQFHYKRMQQWLESQGTSAPSERGMAILRYFKDCIGETSPPSPPFFRQSLIAGGAHETTTPMTIEPATFVGLLDLELTGLEVDTACPLEISVLVVNRSSLQPVAQVDIVLQPPPQLDVLMDEWSQEQHTASGLLHDIHTRGVPLDQAEDRILAVLDGLQIEAVCGASVWFDMLFVQRWFKRLAVRLQNTATWDISVLLECCRWYYPHVYETRPPPLLPEHRTSTDVRSSLALAHHLRQSLFNDNQMPINDPEGKQDLPCAPAFSFAAAAATAAAAAATAAAPIKALFHIPFEDRGLYCRDLPEAAHCAKEAMVPPPPPPTQKATRQLYIPPPARRSASSSS